MPFSFVALVACVIALWLLQRSYAAVEPASAWQEEVVLAVLLGEARNQGPDGILAVANVISNRMSKSGKSAYATVTAKYQFSCLNGKRETDLVTAAHAWIVPRSTRRTAERAAHALIFGPLDHTFPDITLGATHYHEKSVNPDWADWPKRTLILKNHVFYRL